MPPGVAKLLSHHQCVDKKKNTKRTVNYVCILYHVRTEPASLASLASLSTILQISFVKSPDQVSVAGLTDKVLCIRQISSTIDNSPPVK